MICSRKGSAPLFLLFITLLALLCSFYTVSTYYYFSSSSDTKSSSDSLPLVANYSISISSGATTAAAASSSHQQMSSETLPIYLIDTSNADQTSIAASTWGEISANWNRTTQYSNLLSLATAMPHYLPNQYSNNNNIEKKRRQIILIHVGPKLGSTTLRQACRANIIQTCPQINITIRPVRPPGYHGGDELRSMLNECVNTHYFCVTQRAGLDSLLKTQNIEYIHLFPFRNYNEWVKSAIKQLYDRQHGDPKECYAAMRRWENDRCRHYKMEIDIRKYSRIDMDRFQDGVVKRMLEEGKRGYEMEQHTLFLYLHRDLHRTMTEVSRRYQLPMLPGTDLIMKGTRPNGTCDPSLEKMYHGCFSDSLMGFRWDLPDYPNQNVHF